MTGSKDPHEEKRKEALKAIDRVQAESETVAGSTFVRMADRAKNHMSAADKPEEDQIEVWGTRIGRSAGLVFAIGLVIYLVVTYVL
ncbi:hypothetical protein E1180_18060 [Roseibium denhamense]|uniref:DUF3618 domain-containing protein n=1 Tax=Roseibium denhamense TaxID=76305 RepID=A0ABY1PBG4_9HYPH|nr:hypothetical protein [Roseibium denhamense]MTI07411.1 hypothetical protein [Roseibium denhamense]SMP29411.1 hypothetical protein SAMN06265374_3101 [Roseibium denhamense]